MKKFPKILLSAAAAGVIAISALPLSACSKSSKDIVLRVSNWEEYIDLGGWDDDELIDIANPYSNESGGVIGIN
ncbi:MAG: hypothetical protein K2L72_02085, partial [Clostridia bacterium]|nr:hypothetical protein [Clostridia bacterium]